MSGRVQGEARRAQPGRLRGQGPQGLARPVRHQPDAPADRARRACLRGRSAGPRLAGAHAARPTSTCGSCPTTIPRRPATSTPPSAASSAGTLPSSRRDSPNSSAKHPLHPDQIRFLDLLQNHIRLYGVDPDGEALGRPVHQAARRGRRKASSATKPTRRAARAGRLVPDRRTDRGHRHVITTPESPVRSSRRSTSSGSTSTSAASPTR